MATATTTTVLGREKSAATAAGFRKALARGPIGMPLPPPPIIQLPLTRRPRILKKENLSRKLCQQRRRYYVVVPGGLERPANISIPREEEEEEEL